MINFNVKRIVTIIAIVLAAALIVCALAAGINVLTRKPNKENYIYMLYDSDSSYTGEDGKDKYGITWSVKEDGTIIADGEASANTSFEIGTINLTGGTYTFTANEDVDRNKYYVEGIDINGNTIWYSDISNSTNGATHTFGEETIVTFRIVVIEGTELKNVKFYPCVVEGKNPGEYYA